ncbi:cell wall-binding repeat-containing protein [Pyrococcus abyssi]|uniref:Cell wall-binding repeat 2 family protein n=1 Tax=Pyrococcus abyssi (strain GE5 / Orsay) TaxID=272844 RepID=Q9V1D0_PYRAB|nr:cell wall-binding repeat-containing protein [Pyrococcus abyssi]CAB49419.1 Hypothetical protein, containing putative cell wall-binding domain [Pyrococcus abyssi GE5]CCE69886.1 TPA: hypothetical protein PAB0336 [Pyrococcus abyssi GE5]
MRRLLGVLVAMLVALSIASIPAVSAQETQTTTNSNVVILVSNNEADLTLAEKIAELINAQVVITPWGLYNESVLEEILSLNPELVLIIGGPIAVPPVYEDMLRNDFNITVIRAGGNDRAETCERALNVIREKFPQALGNVTIVVVHGWDYPALMEAMKEKGIVPLIVKNTSIDVRNFRKVMLLWSENYRRFMERFRERLGNGTKLIEVNVTADMAERAINIAQERLELAKKVVENSTLGNPERLLAEAEKKLELAKEAYKDGKYGAALGLAVASKRISDVIIRSATEKTHEKFRKVNVRLKVELRILHRVLERLRNRGVDVSLEEKMLVQAERALKNGNVLLAKGLILQIHKELRKKIHKSRGERP